MTADSSLREQLEAATSSALYKARYDVFDLQEAARLAEFVVGRLWPTVVAGLAAARADEREKTLAELDDWAEKTADVADSGWRVLGLNELFEKLASMAEPKEQP